MAKQPKKSQPLPPKKVDWNGSLADFKNVTVNNKPAGAAITNKGGTYTTPKNSQTAYSGPPLAQIAKEMEAKNNSMFSMSGLPLSTSFGIQDTSPKFVANVVKNLAIQEVGGAAIGKLLGKVVSAARPMYYGIHGTTQSGLSKLTPQIGKNTESFLANMKNIGKTSAETPKVFSYKPEIQNVLPVTDYAQMAGAGTGSAYVVKTPAKNIMSNIVDTGKATSAMDAFAAKGLAAEQMSSKAMKVVKEFPMSNYTKRTYDTMEAAWETSQNFSPLSGQISRAIQADKKLQSSIITGMVKGVTRANTIRKK